MFSGSNNISLLGLAHHFQNDNKQRMRDHCFDKYPELKNETNNSGLFALIRDYVIDISFLDAVQKTQERDPEKQTDPDSKFID